MISEMNNDTYNDIEGYDQSSEGRSVYYVMNPSGMCYSKSNIDIFLCGLQLDGCPFNIVRWREMLLSLVVEED